MASPLQQLGAGSLPFNYSDFRGGLNTLLAYDLLTDNESRDCVNVQGTIAGAITKRPGVVTLGAPTFEATALFALESISPSVLIGADNSGNIFSMTSGGVLTNIKTGLSAGAGTTTSFVSGPVVAGQGPLYAMNSVDTPQQWTGAGLMGAWTNVSGAVAVPNGKYMTVAQNQVYVAGTTANPSRVYISAISDPTNWDINSATGANQIDFDPNDGQVITALGRVGPYVLVAKPRKLWVISNPGSLSTAAVTRQISDNIGCISHRSIAAGPEGTFFLSEDRGVYLTTGTKITPVSDKVQPTIDVTPQKQQSCGVYFQGHYYIALGGSQVMLDWDSKLQSWWQHTIGSKQMAIWHPAGTANLYSATDTIQVAGGGVSGTTLGQGIDRLFAPGVLTDRGTAMRWYWAGPWQSPTFYRRRRFPTTWMRKRLRQVRYEGLGQVDFALLKDFNATFPSSPIAADVFGNSAAINLGRAYGQGVAKAFSLVFSGGMYNSYTTAAQVASYTLMLSDRRDGITA